MQSKISTGETKKRPSFVFEYFKKKVIRMTRWQLAGRLCFLMFAAGLIVNFLPAVSRAADNVPRITIQELKEKMDRGEQIVILDVRTGNDYASSKLKINGAVRIPVDQLKDRYQELPANREIIAYCA
jgi:hypothetical protein